MDTFIVDGPCRLEGEVAASGAKNAALPCLAATLLTDEAVTLTNLPDVADIRTMENVLRHIGASVSAAGGTARIQAREIGTVDAPYDLVRKMRASVLVLGPLLARSGRVRVSLPGGCAIGVRPIDLHLAAFRKMGAEIGIAYGYVEAKTARLCGAEIRLGKVTVTGTENVLLGAVLARGRTVISNAAREPEVADLARLLKAMGARISGEGTDTILVEGVEKLHGASHEVLPDRIETGTYAIASAATRGDVTIARCRPDHLGTLCDLLSASGASVSRGSDLLRVGAAGRLAARDVTTAPYPGFPTDLQAQWMALAATMTGVSTITETIFENRFQHAAELARMGARVRLDGSRAVVEGGHPLTGANLMASDLRASAALVIAALAAQGQSVVHRVYHLDRGFERMEAKMASLGGRVRRVAGP